MQSKFRLTLLICITFFINKGIFGQQVSEIYGVIFDKELNTPLPFASIYIPDIEIGTYANKNGEFSLSNVKNGKYYVLFQMTGYQTEKKEIIIKKENNEPINVYLNKTTLVLDEVSVVAKENRNSMATSSLVESQAIEHIQANSLADIMHLIPGQEIRNNDLNSASFASLRSISDNNKDLILESSGISIVMDGNPISNDANLQSTNTTLIGTGGYFESTNGGGTDLREITTDNIESVEVIRGIPSAKYGNISSGIILVNTKKGQTPITGRIKFNATTVSGFIGNGIKLGKKGGILNSDFDYTYSQKDIRTKAPSFSRIKGRITHSNSIFNNKLKTTNNISLSRTLDNNIKDSDETNFEKRYSENMGIRLASNGKINTYNKIISKINYNASFDYQNQESYTRQLNSSSVKPLSTAMIDTTMEIDFIPAEYYSATFVKGKPVYFDASLFTQSLFNIKNTKHKITLGAEWKTYANLGDGRYYEDGYLPSSRTRPRKFSDIPAQNRISAFIEELFITTVLKKELKIQAGIRYQNMQPTSITEGEVGTTILPRINVSYEAFNNFKIRGGFGKTAKAPALIYQYPDNYYADAISFQHYSTSYPDESLAIMTTKVFSTYNNELKPSITTKFEGGLEYITKQATFNITLFNEKLKNGYGFSDILSTTPYPNYNIYFYIPGWGQKPTLDYNNVDTLLVRNSYKSPINNKTVTKKGIEFTINTKKIELTGTALNITGAYISTFHENDSPEIDINSQYYTGNNDKLIGVYNTNSYEYERFLTTFMVIQHIPKVKLLLSLTAQVTWFDNYYTEINNAEPIGYYDKFGEYFKISQEEAANKYQFLTKNIDNSVYNSINKPALMNINLRITKEIKKNIKLSVYTNNMFMNHPTYDNPVTGTREKRNSELYFGGELSVMF